MPADVAAASVPGPRADAARIIHAAVRGRVRLKVKGLKGSPELKLRLTRGLSRWGSIRAVWPNTDTGNVLVLVDSAVPAEHVAELIGRVICSGDSGHPGERTSETPWHQREAREIAADLGASLERGLSPEDARRRLAVSGPNRVSPPPGRSPFDIAIAQLQSLPTVLIMAAGVVSLLTGGLADALAIFGVVTLNAAIGFTVESRSERTIRLLGVNPERTASVLRDGKRLNISADRLVPGDVMLLSRGDTIAADARICRAHDLFADEAPLTGESQPVRKQAAALSGRSVALGDRRNMVYRGTVVTSGTGAAIAIATGAQTEVGQIQRVLGVTGRPQTPLEAELETLGGWLTWLSVALGISAVMLGLARGVALSRLLDTSVALAIAAIPEGLPTVASTTLARGVEVMRRRGVLVRRLDAVQTLGAVQVLCFDKTGTLTFNRMAAVALACGDCAEEIAPLELPDRIAHGPVARLLEIGILCSEVAIDPVDGTLTGSETETALVRLATDAGLAPARLRRQRPLLSIRHRSEAYRFMATTHAMPDGSEMVAIKGDPLEVLDLCDSRLTDDGTRPLAWDERAAIREANAAMAGRALRVLGLAYRTDTTGSTGELQGLIWVGLIGLADSLRPSARTLMPILREAGVHPLVLTGDQVATARAIAHDLDLNGRGTPVVVDSAELAGMNAAAIAEAAQSAHVFARVSPVEKLRIVRALQQAGVVVGMVGDGFNDSPALKAANVGIAVAGAGGEAAREAADIVMQTGDLGAVAVAIEQGRAAHANVRRATGYLLGTNFSEIAFVLTSLAAGSSRPLTAAQLLWINIVSDVLPGVGLSSEPPETQAMRRPPRSGDQAIVTSTDVPELLLEGGLIATGALASTAWGALRFGAEAPAARTMGFGSLVLGQLLHAFNRRASGAERGTNPAFAGAIGLAFGAQAVALAVPALRGVLGVVPIGAADIAVTLAGGVAPYLVNRMLRADHSATVSAAVSGSAARSVASST